MATVDKRPLAEADLEEIWWYIAQDNPDAADKMLERCDSPRWYPESLLRGDGFRRNVDSNSLLSARVVFFSLECFNFL